MWTLLRVLLRERQELPIVLVQGITWGHSLFSTSNRMDSNLQEEPSNEETNTGLRSLAGRCYKDTWDEDGAPTIPPDFLKSEHLLLWFQL